MREIWKDIKGYKDYKKEVLSEEGEDGRLLK
jgi:hypothetical protein